VETNPYLNSSSSNYLCRANFNKTLCFSPKIVTICNTNNKCLSRDSSKTKWTSRRNNNQPRSCPNCHKWLNSKDFSSSNRRNLWCNEISHHNRNNHYKCPCPCLCHNIRIITKFKPKINNSKLTPILIRQVNRRKRIIMVLVRKTCRLHQCTKNKELKKPKAIIQKRSRIKKQKLFLSNRRLRR